MPQIPLHPRPSVSPTSGAAIQSNPLPPLLHTPSGLALLELQGSIHFPTTPSADATNVGKLVFPLYNPELNGQEDTKWMKKVYLYVGENQRLSGEVKKLGRPFAVVRKRQAEDVVMGDGGNGLAEAGGGNVGESNQEELEIVEIVRYKLLFSTRPEPVS